MNPLSASDIGLPTSTATLDAGISNIILLLTELIGMLAVVFVMYGGLQYVMSQGDAKKIASAKSTLLYAIIGLVLSIAGYAIVRFVTTSIK